MRRGRRRRRVGRSTDRLQTGPTARTPPRPRPAGPRCRSSGRARRPSDPGARRCRSPARGGTLSPPTRPDDGVEHLDQVRRARPRRRRAPRGDRRRVASRPRGWSRGRGRRPRRRGGEPRSASSTVDIPTRSAPIVRSIRISAGVSKLRAAQARRTHPQPRSGRTACSADRSRALYRSREIDEPTGQRWVRSGATHRVLAGQVELVRHRHDRTDADRPPQRARSVGQHDRRRARQHTRREPACTTSLDGVPLVEVDAASEEQHRGRTRPAAARARRELTVLRCPARPVARVRARVPRAGPAPRPARPPTAAQPEPSTTATPVLAQRRRGSRQRWTAAWNGSGDRNGRQAPHVRILPQRRARAVWPPAPRGRRGWSQVASDAGRRDRRVRIASRAGRSGTGCRRSNDRAPRHGPRSPWTGVAAVLGALALAASAGPGRVQPVGRAHRRRRRRASPVWASGSGAAASSSSRSPRFSSTSTGSVSGRSGWAGSWPRPRCCWSSPSSPRGGGHLRSRSGTGCRSGCWSVWVVISGFWSPDGRRVVLRDRPVRPRRLAFFATAALLCDSHRLVQQFLRGYWVGGLFGSAAGILGARASAPDRSDSAPIRTSSDCCRPSMIPLTVYYRRHAPTPAAPPPLLRGPGRWCSPARPVPGAARG